MNIKKYMQSDYGKTIISVILGIGLSTLFRKSCGDKKCMKFEGPSAETIKEKVYNFDDECYRFKPNPVKCNSNKKIVQFA